MAQLSGSSEHNDNSTSKSDSNLSSNSQPPDSSDVETSPSRLREIFDNQEDYNKVLSSTGEEAQKYLDKIEQFLKETKDLSLTEENSVIIAQQMLAMRSGVLPSSYYLSEVVSLGPPVASGGTADIYKGLLGRERVGLKILRLSKENFNRVRDDIMKETILSKHLRHPNILSLYGVCQSRQRLSLVSPWMENGDLAFYLKQNPEANRLKLTTRASTDIYKAEFGEWAVCLKTARFHLPPESEHFLKVVSREAIAWGQLRHPNVLPFYGVYRYNAMAALVTPWMDNGDIQSYLQRHQDSNRCLLAYDVANGLQFLHVNNIVHGDLKGSNVLMMNSGRACIADFGLASVSDPDVVSWISLSSYSSKGGSVRWLAPELFDPFAHEELYHVTKATDIYAFASVVYEVFAGQLPFGHLSSEPAIMKKILSGERPKQPQKSSPSWNIWGLTDTIWTLLESCWKANPMQRPTVDLVIQLLDESLSKDLKFRINDELS
ncbi:hypothetical protein H0H92_004466 [Tricholoma furcatifolium]|nr:hypothetical protein H0H92_004466 [Tricholoma furcatifolium]